jgi:hypothetical protein
MKYINCRLPALLIILTVGLTLWKTALAADVDCAKRGKSEMSADEIQEALTLNSDRLMALQGVVGTGLGVCRSGKPCIQVYAREITPELDRHIRDILDGYPYAVVKTEPLRPLTNQDP